MSFQPQRNDVQGPPHRRNAGRRGSRRSRARRTIASMQWRWTPHKPHPPAAQVSDGRSAERQLRLYQVAAACETGLTDAGANQQGDKGDSCPASRQAGQPGRRAG